MSDLLVLFVDNLPLLLECGDELLAFVIGHEELLLVAVVLLLDLHLADHLVLILDLSLDLLDVLRHLAEVLLLEVVLVGVGWELGCGQDVLNGICNDVVFVTYQAHDWLLLLLGNGNTLHIVLVLELGEGAGLLKHWVAGSLLSEAGGLGLHCTLRLADGERHATHGVGSAFGSVVTAHVGDVGL